MNINKAKYIHFIGIGGIGTSAIAQILHNKGKKISGSDLVPSELTKSLKLSGIDVKIGHEESFINKKHDLIVYSPAIPNSNPELKKAKELKIKTISYSHALGQLTKDHFTIAVAGTHGKSTTTAMIALIATKAGLDPSVVIGTKIKQFKNRNFRVGDSNLLIIEACEYKRTFLHVHPDILVLTNIEADHLDYYKDLEDYKNAFKDLAKRVSKKGAIIINEKGAHLKDIVGDAKCPIIAWKNTGNLKPKVPGKFNIENAENAATACKTLGIDNKIIEKVISNFGGTWRRMEIKRKKGYTCTFIDDYAHHPTEIQLTLATIREQNPTSKILCIFQPHQYSRTHHLLKEFGRSFYDVDKVIIPNIYRVRDTQEDIEKVSTDDLVAEINNTRKRSGRAKKHKASNGHGLRETADYIKKNSSKFDIIITMGAGDITDIYRML
ncbi:MAG: Mur ligase domain-containing protein [Nitrospirota bacterium]